VSHCFDLPKESLSSLKRDRDFVGALLGRIFYFVYILWISSISCSIFSIALLIMFLMYGFGYEMWMLLGWEAGVQPGGGCVIEAPFLLIDQLGYVFVGLLGCLCS
jgi:hypothetical protein